MADQGTNVAAPLTVDEDESMAEVDDHHGPNVNNDNEEIDDDNNDADVKSENDESDNDGEEVEVLHENLTIPDDEDEDRPGTGQKTVYQHSKYSDKGVKTRPTTSGKEPIVNKARGRPLGSTMVLVLAIV